MALILCPDCTGKVSTQALACPHCGRPFATNEAQSTASATIIDMGPCPELPTDLSIGKQIVNWSGDAGFYGYYSSEENATPAYY